MDLLPSMAENTDEKKHRWAETTDERAENKDENQPITNLKPRTFANTSVTSRKVKVFTRRLLFCSNYMMQAE